MSTKKIFYTIIIFIIPIFSFGQKDSVKKFCDPKLVGMQRSKGFVISYERVFNSTITSTSSDTSIGNASAKVSRNNRFNIQLKLPIWNRPALKVILGFRYFFEEFNFKTPEGISYPFYKNLQDKNLKTIGSNLNILKSISEIHYLGFRVSADLNGDYSSKEFAKSSFLRYTIAAIYGWKKCETKTTGIGLYYSYTFGRRFIVPAFVYNNTFNTHWGVEAFLPASLRVRHNFSRKTLLYGGYEIEGNAYHIKISNPPFANYSSLELRRSNLRLTVDFEQEIYDFLWFGISTGLRQALGFNVAKEASSRRDNLITNKLSLTPFIYFNIFIVPPRTLENKIIYGRDRQ